MLIQIYEYMFKFPQGAFNVFLRVQCANNVITHYLADTIEYFFCPQTDDSGRVSEGPSHDRSVFAEGLAAHIGVSKY